jgi:phospho-N-acetylmuramoyl-pentapeptide-transferase
MIYHLFEYIQDTYDFPGSGLFNFLSFRAVCAVLASLIISLLFGKKLIRALHKKQVGETVRDLGLKGQIEKQGTPTMGGLVILLSIIVPTVLFADLGNIYIQIMLITTLWLGGLGFLDDYIKVFKKDKEGLKGKFKVVGQVGIGIIVGVGLYFNDGVSIKEKAIDNNLREDGSEQVITRWEESKSLKTTIPFVKNNEFDYADIMPEGWEDYAWLIFIPIVIFIVAAVSNGANITDGLDGLATGTSAIIGLTLAILAYVSGNYIWADYLNIMYIPHSGELVIFISAFVGACIGFLWYNSYPAQVFMGDTGSLALGGIIAVFAIAIRKELLIPVLCGIFLVENLSVMIQVGWFKYTKQKSGVGRRVFLMAPLHHHFQKKGYHESKIVSRFWIVGVLLAIITIVTLKLR